MPFTANKMSTLPKVPETASDRIGESTSASATEARRAPVIDKDASLLGSIVELVRVRQWPKNAVVFAPLLMSTEISSATVTAECYLFVLFCLSSSLVYVVNDSLDAKHDRLHPDKRLRPLASGRLGVAGALTTAIALAATVVALSLVFTTSVVFLVLFFIAMNVCYSCYLKRIAIVEIFIISLGFLLRVTAAFLAISMSIPAYLLMFVFFACLFLSLGKRRKEATLAGREQATSHRAVLSDYNMPFLNAALMITAANAILFHALYTFGQTAGGDWPVSTLFSSIVVTYVIFRYLQIVYVEGRGGDPTETLMKDKAIVSGIAVWIMIRLAAHLG